jgi:hypothetical protein
LDKEVIKSSLGQIDRELDNAREALKQLENEYLYDESRGGYEYPREALEASLADACDLIIFALDAAGLEGPKNQLKQRWAEFQKKPSGLSAAGPTPWDSFESKPLMCLERVIQGMRGAAGEGISSQDAYELTKLESMLRNTGFLLYRRGITPTKEADVQRVMNDYLGGYFTDYVTDFDLPTRIKNFKPDGGVRSLKAAIEFKFADSEQEVKQELDAIYADMIGYSGSEDWKRYYSVMYQTKPFVPEEAYKQAIIRGGREWTPILVTAPGARKPKKAKAIKMPLKKPKKPAKKISKKRS